MAISNSYISGPAHLLRLLGDSILVKNAQPVVMEVEIVAESVVEVAAVLLVVVQPLPDVAVAIILPVRMTETAGTGTTTEETATEPIAHVAQTIGKHS